MTATASHEPKAAVSLPGILLAPVRGLGRFLVALAEATPQAKALARLSQVSDAQLAARGLTRDGEVRRILGLTASI